MNAIEQMVNYLINRAEAEEDAAWEKRVLEEAEMLRIYNEFGWPKRSSIN